MPDNSNFIREANCKTMLKSIVYSTQYNFSIVTSSGTFVKNDFTANETSRWSLGIWFFLKIHNVRDLRSHIFRHSVESGHASIRYDGFKIIG